MVLTFWAAALAKIGGGHKYQFRNCFITQEVLLIFSIHLDIIWIYNISGILFFLLYNIAQEVPVTTVYYGHIYTFGQLGCVDL